MIADRVIEEWEGLGDRFHVLFAVENVTQIAKAFVTPIVKAAKAGSGTTLSIQIHRGHTKPDQSRKERLFHVGKLLEKECVK